MISPVKSPKGRINSEYSERHEESRKRLKQYKEVGKKRDESEGEAKGQNAFAQPSSAYASDSRLELYCVPCIPVGTDPDMTWCSGMRRLS